jgi:hypothetical protein
MYGLRNEKPVFLSWRWFEKIVSEYHTPLPNQLVQRNTMLPKIWWIVILVAILLLFLAMVGICCAALMKKDKSCTTKMRITEFGQSYSVSSTASAPVQRTMSETIPGYEGPQYGPLRKEGRYGGYPSVSPLYNPYAQQRSAAGSYGPLVGGASTSRYNSVPIQYPPAPTSGATMSRA